MGELPLVTASASRWQAEPHVAWVEGDDRIVLVDLTDPASAEPVLCPEPAASLWRAVADGPVLDTELLKVAESLVGPEQAPSLVEAFLSAFLGQGWLEAKDDGATNG